MSVQQRSTLNLLVPAQGGTQVVNMTLPGDGNYGTGNYGIDFRSLTMYLEGTLFIPQACKIDCSLLAVNVVFGIPAINYYETILAGTARTFNFPALNDLSVTLTPASGTPSIPTFWYDWPAFPDEGGSFAGSTVAVTTIPAVQPRGSVGTDHSSAAPTLAAHLLLTIPVNSNRNGYIIQNQSADQLQAVYDDGLGGTATILLLAPVAANQPGGSLAAAGMPHWGQIRVYGPNAGAQVAARDW